MRLVQVLRSVASPTRAYDEIFDHVEFLPFSLFLAAQVCRRGAEITAFHRFRLARESVICRTCSSCADVDFFIIIYL